MQGKLKIYNTHSKVLETFEPINAPFVGMYVCGPTVYGHPHLGHSRGPIFFDFLFRYLNHCGYKVRYVKNITDVGHLINDADSGDDKIQKQAKLDQLEPMEVVQKYTESYHDALRKLNLNSPSIEPRATGHILEQIDMVKKIIKNGFAYESNGSVYFDVLKYNDAHDYGELSGRKLEDLIAGSSSRELEGQSEKQNPNDFALWKKAEENHLMKWESPWGMGFPGWHIECSAMSCKYLGDQFDIHGGGLDLLFPHHESEIAQSKASCGTQPAKYWMHHNMITINGQKMAKSLNNGIMLHDFYTGEHALLEKAYSPMTLKFFQYQTHYRSTMDFSNEALQASEKGLARLMNGIETLKNITPGIAGDFVFNDWKEKCYKAINDDLNSPILIAHLFEAIKYINSVNDGHTSMDNETLNDLTKHLNLFVFDLLGLENEKEQSNSEGDLMQLIITLRNAAKENKDYSTSDTIRDELNKIGFTIKDGKEGTTYSKN